MLWRDGCIELGKHQINDGHRQLDVTPPLHPRQGQCKGAQPSNVGGWQVPHQPVGLGGRVCQRGRQGTAQVGAVPGYQRPLVFQQRQTGATTKSAKRGSAAGPRHRRICSTLTAGPAASRQRAASMCPCMVKCRGRQPYALRDAAVWGAAARSSSTAARCPRRAAQCSGV